MTDPIRNPWLHERSSDRPADSRCERCEGRGCKPSRGWLKPVNAAIFASKINRYRSLRAKWLERHVNKFFGNCGENRLTCVAAPRTQLPRPAEVPDCPPATGTRLGAAVLYTRNFGSAPLPAFSAEC